MAHIKVNQKFYTVKKGKNGKYYYIKDGRRVYTRSKIRPGPKPKKSTRKPVRKSTRKPVRKSTRKPKKSTRKPVRKSTRKPKKSTRKPTRKVVKKVSPRVKLACEGSPRGCTNMSHLKKYKIRSSPPYPANECKRRTMRGNDGDMYVSKSNVNGVYRWVKKN